MISFVQLQKGEGIPIPLPLLLDDPEISEIKCPNQFTNPQNSLLGISLPSRIKSPSNFENVTKSSLEIKCAVFAN